jgi:hypothetical protein
MQERRSDRCTVKVPARHPPDGGHAAVGGLCPRTCVLSQSFSCTIARAFLPGSMIQDIQAKPTSAIPSWVFNSGRS